MGIVAYAWRSYYVFLTLDDEKTTDKLKDPDSADDFKARKDHDLRSSTL